MHFIYSFSHFGNENTSLIILDYFRKFRPQCGGGGLSSSVEAVHSVHDFSLLCIHSLVWPTLLLMNKFKLQAQENATIGPKTI